MIAAPPLSADGVKLIVAWLLPPMAMTAVGALGGKGPDCLIRSASLVPIFVSAGVVRFAMLKSPPRYTFPALSRAMALP